MARWIGCLLFIAITFSQGSSEASRAAVFPLDALYSDEIRTVVRLIKSQVTQSPDVSFPSIRLLEPAKDSVRNWSPGQALERRALAVVRDAQRTLRIEISITNNQITSVSDISGSHTALQFLEWDRARKAVTRDPRWQAAMRRRNISQLSDVGCTAVTAGIFTDLPIQPDRPFRVLCYSRATIHHPSGLLISGVQGIVDSATGEVLEIRDTVPVPHPTETQIQANADKTASPPQPLNPYILYGPLGGNIDASGALNVKWLRWRFHVRIEKRSGPVLSLVQWQSDEKTREIAYQISFAETFVPYMSTAPEWRFRGYLDQAELGVGQNLAALRAGRDCPRQSIFVSASLPDEAGEPYEIPNAICLFERTTGDPEFRHTNPNQAAPTGRLGHELVVRTIPVIGNYTYIYDWVFSADGNLRVRVGSTGVLATRAVPEATLSSTEAAGSGFEGTLVAPFTLAPWHDHYFALRLDMDIDGPNNTLLSEHVKSVVSTDEHRVSYWKLDIDQVPAEGPLPTHRSGSKIFYRLINPDIRNRLGQSTGYDIRMGATTHSLLSEHDPLQARGAYSASNLWLTRFQPDELTGSGEFALGRSVLSGLPSYVEDKEDTFDDDLVIWAVLGFHHIPRPEEWPIMSTMWREIVLRPNRFFSSNPALQTRLLPIEIEGLNNDEPIEAPRRRPRYAVPPN